MVLTGLLIIAAVSLVLGVVLANVTWLIVSLVASVFAAFFLYRSWGAIKERRTNRPRRKSPQSEPSASSPPARAAATGRPDEVWVVDGRPAYHRPGCAELAGQEEEPVPLSQALEDGFTPCAICAPPTGTAPEVPAEPEVWVVDGSPEFHDRGCASLAGRPAEPIPLSQALEDGFVPCALCRSTPAAAAAGPTPSAERQVWVADGYPEYHHQGCEELSGL